MKTRLLIILSVFLLMLSAFTQDSRVNELLQNQESKKELFDAIQNDHQLMMEFMQNMHQNQHAMMMWQDGQMSKSNMMQMMQNHPQKMQMMMNNMVEVCASDSAMSRNMFVQMGKYPRMKQMMDGHGKGMMKGATHHMN